MIMGIKIGDKMIIANREKTISKKRLMNRYIDQANTAFISLATISNCSSVILVEQGILRQVLYI